MDASNSSIGNEFSAAFFGFKDPELVAEGSWTLDKAQDVLADVAYTSCYCEENIYMLCKKLSEVGLAAPDASDLFVVFISNANRQIPIWRQRNSKDEAGLCIWDYHVICIQNDPRRQKPVQVWDLDTTMTCPTTLEEYVAQAFQPWVALKSEFSRLYRVIAAPIYLRFFASDRRHMKNKDGSWIASPPMYDCLLAEDGAMHTLEEFITMSDEHVVSNSKEAESLLMYQKYGIVMDERGLQGFFN